MYVIHNRVRMGYLVEALVKLQTLLLVTCISPATQSSYSDECSPDETITIRNLTGSLKEPQNLDFYNSSGADTCKWVIEDNSNRDVIFFNISSLSGNGACSSLKITDNTGTSDQTWSGSCGSVLGPVLYRSASHSALVSFVSQVDSPSDTDLSISWWYQDVCSGGPYTSNIGDVIRTVYSPTSPWYEGRENCSYQLTVVNDYIRVSIVKFETVSSSCDTGYLEIANALDPTEIWIKFCKPLEHRHIFGAGQSALVTHYRTSDESSFQITFEESTVKGMTKAQREGAIIGSSIGGGVFLVMLIACCVVVEKKSDKWKRQHPIGSQTKSSHPKQAFDSNLASTDYKLPSYTTPPAPDVRAWNEAADAKSSQKHSHDETTTPRVKTKRSKKPVEKLPHLMISYQWDVKKRVLDLKERLSQAGYRVWIDIEQMHKAKDTFDAMARAIDDAVVVIPILTSKYQESVNCRKEIQYADKSDKPIVPIRLEKKFKPTKWLSFLLGNTLWHDLSNPETFEDNFTNFLDAILESGEAAFVEEAKDAKGDDEAEDSSSKTDD